MKIAAVLTLLMLAACDQPAPQTAPAPKAASGPCGEGSAYALALNGQYWANDHLRTLDYQDAARDFQKAIKTLGEHDYSAIAADGTPAILEQADGEAKRNDWRLAANLRAGVLQARLDLYKKKYGCP